LSVQSQYSDRVIAGMQMLYGKGFLSPGGADEVRELTDGVDVEGRHVLDYGCGIGGASLMLARDCGAGHVTGVDIETQSIARAAAAAQEEGLADRIDFVHMAPGPLPVESSSVDIVITKDVICHIADKAAAFADMFRVLKPGGHLLCADFQDGEAEGEAKAFYGTWVERLSAYGLDFHFEGAEVYRRAIEAAGFVELAVRDHTATSAAVARRERDFAKSDEAAPVREVLGEDYFKVRTEVSALRVEALETRGLLHLHFVARRPS
jgi:phosphoethanolamine N-methyltransferase